MTAIPTFPRWRSALQSLTNASLPIAKFSDYVHKKGSTMTVHLGGVHPTILTADPDFIRHILQKNSRKYHKINWQMKNLRHFFGNGLLTSEGSYWLKQRRLIQPCFNKNRLKEVMKLMDREADRSLQNLDAQIQANPEIDIFEHMKRMTRRIITNAIFSTDLNEEEYEKIDSTLPRLQNFSFRMMRQPHMQWWLKWSGQLKTHENLRDEGNSIIRSYIEKRRASGVESDDLLQMLLDVRYQDTGEGMTDTQLLDEIKIIFIAGYETSATGLSWVWYLLSKHPEVMQKLREEINRVIPDGQISFERLSQLEYTQQVIDETFRLYPPAWVTNRVAIEDDEFKGIPIKKGTSLATFIYGLHHSKDLWENPESFQPERFAKDKKKSRHPFAYLPFGSGPRMCIGKQFGTTEIKLILAKMVRRYEVSLAPKQKVKVLPVITLQPKDGIRMRLQQNRINPGPQEVGQHPPLTRGAERSRCPFHW